MSEGMTVFFDIDVRSFDQSPFKIDTPFGLPQTIGRGNTFERHDLLEMALKDACERLAKAGFPADDLEAILDGTTPPQTTESET
jgi:hypothetical protein